MKTQWIAITVLATISMAIPCSQAQNKSEAAGLSGLAHVAIRVSDVDREVAFFNKLGYELAFANTKDGKTEEAYIKINDVQFLEISQASPPQRPAGFADAAFESADLNALDARYAAAGLKPTEVHKGGAGNLIFMVDAPDGSETVLTQYLPGSRQMDDKGKHLGITRISEELIGFELPVKDLAASQAFYESLGFDAEKSGAELWLTLPSFPDLRIELHAARAGDQVRYLFAVADAKQAANVLRDAGLKVDRHEKMDDVADAEGNVFVLVESQASSRHRAVITRRRKSDE